jgi:hypothetical protein
MESDRDLDPEDYTVAWIAPLEVETQAAWYMLDNEHKGQFAIRRGDDYVYTAGDINGHNVVIATFPAGHSYGVGSAAALASQVKKASPIFGSDFWLGSPRACPTCLDFLNAISASVMCSWVLEKVTVRDY